MNPIGVVGLDFVRDGRRWVYRGATNFMLFLRYCLGEDLAPALYADAQVYEVLGLLRHIPDQIGYRHLTVDDDRYYEDLDAFADELAARGKDLSFCVFADVHDLGLSLEWCQRHWARCLEVLTRKPNVLIRLANEYWHPTNRLDISQFVYPSYPITTPICSGDTPDASLSPNYQHWDWVAVHPRRDFPKMIKNCWAVEPAYAIGKPVVVNEPFKANEFEEPNKSYTTPRYFFQAARAMSGCNGGTFHSYDGVYSRALGPTQDRCRRAFFAGLNVADDWED